MADSSGNNHPPTQPTPAPTAVPEATPPIDEDQTKWGTRIMGQPAAPTTHPDNQRAASWVNQHHPYVVYSPVDKPSENPCESVIHMFNSWSHRAETVAKNIWHNLKTGPSVSGTAWGKLNLTAKALTEGGFESHYKQIFATDPNERLKKTFACYLSTSTGPVAGTLYLSTVRVAFCSDRPLSFRAPSGQETWSYYKVMIPFANIANVNPVVMKQNPPEKYIQIVTIDGHEFWFMGFVNFEKASHHLLDSVSDFGVRQNASIPIAS
ncbi:GEM-like protein 5 [Coffea arabica]|uniref:GEM-like protein 5 n=1 Tax=Coffea arabica TaxID=13443 RepID=A0A6P6S914_COFAR|nr:GEM-like protein 5 [Coffea arabica]